MRKLYAVLIGFQLLMNQHVIANDANHQYSLTIGLESEFKNGVEEGSPAECEALAGNRCWWVDSDAADGGDGSYQHPLNSFEVLTGYRSSSSQNVTGTLAAGDHIYVKGYFDMRDYVFGQKHPNIYISKLSRYDSAEPTVIKSWKGAPRAIFDGRQLDYAPSGWQYDGMVYIAPSVSKELSFKVSNIEIRNAYGIGIALREGVQRAEVANVVVRGTIADKSGTAGAITINAKESTLDYRFLVRNSEFYNNALSPSDGTSKASIDNNIGTISIVGKSTTLDSSNIMIRNNMFEDGGHAIRHKKSGNFSSKVFYNMFKNTHSAMFLRSKKSDIRHNLLVNVDTAFIQDRENQKVDMAISISNNTIVRDEDAKISSGAKIFRTQNRLANKLTEIQFNRNLISVPQDSYLFSLGGGSKDEFDLNWWSSSYNYVHIGGSGQVLKNKNTSYYPHNVWAVLSDSTSMFMELNLTDQYKPLHGAPACQISAGSEYEYVGAFKCTCN